MTIAVTGATGQLGRLVLDELLTSQEPDSLVAIVRDAAKAAELVARGVQVRVADYSDPAALEAALTGVDRLLLVSGSEVGSRVAQHGNVIDAARAAGVGFIAYTSVLAADTTELILALCAGGSAFSHVNDAGFWLVTSYFGMSVPQSLKSWTMMKIIACVMGLAIVMGAHALLP